MVRRLLGAIGIIVAALPPAAAQTYDGAGRLRFGAFLQGHALPGDETKPALASADLNGFGLGAALGYDWSLGRRWVVGLEADGVVTDGAVTINGSKYNSDYLASLRGRLGYQVYPDLLVYGTAGYAMHGLHYRGVGTQTLADPDARMKASTTLGGYAVGAGMEWHHRNVIVFSEYLFSDFERWNFAGGFGINHSLDTEAHQFRVGVKWVYGRDR